MLVFMRAFVKECVLAVLFCAAVGAQAQNLQEAVYLKNGSIVRGVIIERVPDVSIKIRTADGAVLSYKMEEVEKITKETPQGRPGRSKFGARLDGGGLTAGYRRFIDAGYTLGTGSDGESRLELATSHGYQLNPYLYVGLGRGCTIITTGASRKIPTRTALSRFPSSPTCAASS